MAEATIPQRGGGQIPVSAAETSDLEYWARRIPKDLNDPDKARFADSNRRMLAGVHQELERRQKGGAQQAAQRQEPRTEIVQRPAVEIQQGSMSDLAMINEQLAKAAEHCHLVSPATSCGSLPDGCEVVFSCVHVDTRGDAAEIYDVGNGRWGLAKKPLQTIASALEIGGDYYQSRRLDNGMNQHYVHFRAVGHVRNFDGSSRPIIGEREVDLRQNSAQIAGKSAKEIAGMRRHILSRAETMAQLRAIRSVGIKSSYTMEELRTKPFVVARLMLTGRTDDPEMKRFYDKKRAEVMFGGLAACYGQVPPPQLPAPEGHEPPPLDEDDNEFAGYPDWDGEQAAP